MSFELHHGDCLDIMPTIAAGSVGMVFADLPYGIHKQKWDTPIPLAPLWAQLRRAGRHDSCYCFTATQPFAHRLLASNLEDFRYDLVWNKRVSAAFGVAKIRPLPLHEGIYLFGKNFPYYPIKTMREKPVKVTPGRCKDSDALMGLRRSGNLGKTYVDAYPNSVLNIPVRDAHRGKHPTQKPLALLEWLIATYTSPGETVLDPVMGSGTTGVACANLGRRFIGIEKDATYFSAAKSRIEAAYAQAKVKDAI